MASPPTPVSRVRARALRPQAAALVYAPSPDIARWAAAELEREDITAKVAPTMNHLFSALTDDPSSRPHFLIIDLDAVSAAELIRLHSIRERGWFGALVALGSVPPALRSSLAIDAAVAPPFSRDQLRDAVSALRTPVETMRLPRIRDIA